MLYQLLANLVVLVHFAFIVFVLFGGVLALRWQRVAWVHLPTAAWGVAVEFFGWICPLTPLENRLRRAAGDEGYSGGFIEHYIMPIIYPPGLTDEMQWLLGSIVIIVNAAIYFMVWRRRCARTHCANQTSER